LNPSTHHLLGGAELARMKRGARLVNTARGGLVDADALLAALEDGALAGAALDVRETEPPPAADALVRADNVVTTPHAAWYSEESYLALKTEVAREAVRVVRGERPRSPVNTPVLEASRG
jgi:D-3-phosphoglycerate dehydrogenase